MATFPHTSRTLFIAAIAALSWFGGSAWALDDLKEVPLLIRRGETDAALRMVDRILASNPHDPAARFQKSLVLTQQGKTDEALAVLQALISDYPELPEPYNNIAVLYAARGNYTEAIRQLQVAIASEPTYAVAHQNLGDVYAKLADVEYERTLKLDPNDSAVKTKRTSLRELLVTLDKSTIPVQRPAQATAAH